MKVTILGSGTSTGVPQIGCQCPVCTSTDIHDKRLRASAWIEVNNTHILIDCGPDFREQMLHQPFTHIDGVLLTHEHYDHTGGLDDLRPFCAFGDIPIYANHQTVHDIRNRMPYCFLENKYPGVPLITVEEVKPHIPFHIKEVEILPLQIMHGTLPILGYRIGKLVYITDLKTLPENEWQYLEGVDCLIVNALRKEPHLSHQTLDDALDMADKIGAKETYLIHMSHHIGLHEKVSQELPPHVHLTYDGMSFLCED